MNGYNIGKLSVCALWRNGAACHLKALWKKINTDMCDKSNISVPKRT